MNTAKGTWKNGQIVLDEPANWPEGSRVLIETLPADETWGLDEKDWDDSPEAVAAWLQWYDSLEPLELSPEEEADLAAWRQQIQDYTQANMSRRIEGLFE